MINRSQPIGLVAAVALALLLIGLVAACGPTTFGRTTGTAGMGGTPGALPQTGGTAPSAITATQGLTGGQAATGTMTTTQVPTGTPSIPAPGAVTATQTTTSTASTLASGTPGSGMAYVEVVLKEYNIEMPMSLPSGVTVFRVTNATVERHSLVIEGPGFEASPPALLESGQTAALTVTLTAGDYTFYCPVDGHRLLGMEQEVTVTQGS